MRYRVSEGGLEASAIGEVSRRARRVTSHLIFHRGRLGMRLFGTTNSGISTFRVSCLETIPFFEFCKGT